jgi:uncharacterized protein (TIGR00251 family)
MLKPTWQNGALDLSVRVQPAAKKTEWFGWMEDGALKVRLCAPPVDGKANRALCQFMAEQFDVPVRHILLLRGETARLKRLRVQAPRQYPELIKEQLGLCPTRGSA